MIKALVIQTAFIGDAILSTAILEDLNSDPREFQIDLLVRKGNESLFKDHPFINEVIIWDKKSKKYPNLFRILKEVRKKKYDVLFNLQRFGATGFLTAFSKAQTKIGFDKNPWSFMFDIKVEHRIAAHNEPIIHEIERVQELSKAYGTSGNSSAKLYPNDESFNKVSGYQSEEYICIAPSSVWFTKQFPKDQYRRLIESLNNYRVYLIGGKDDIQLCDELAKDLNHVQSLSGKLSLLDSAALMNSAKMNFTNDSAPLHLCTALNAPVRAIFCSTVPYFGFGPYGDKGEIIQTSDTLNCRPCGLHGKSSCPQGHFNCANTIKHDQLIKGLA